MKNCGVVTDRSWDQSSGSRYAGNGDTDFIIDSLFEVKKARERRIYSDEVPMADIAEFNFRQGARKGSYDLKTTNLVISAFKKLAGEYG